MPKGLQIAIAVFFIATLRAPSLAQQGDAKASKLYKLEQELEALEKRDQENDRKRVRLKGDLEALKKVESFPDSVAEKTHHDDVHDSLDQALDDVHSTGGSGVHVHGPSSRDLWSKQVGDARLRLMDLSADLLVAIGSSSERDSSLETLQGGEHDPKQRGFTFQAFELSALGAVDPYFESQAHIVFFLDAEGETNLELEEVFLTTLDLPFGLGDAGVELEIGHFLTEFGRQNPQHPHSWQWIDQPVVLSRFFGGDGLRAPGFRLGWLTPLPWFSELHFGVQNATGETLVSFFANDEVFEDRPIGGRPFVEQDVRDFQDMLYLGRWDHAWDFSEEISSKLGFSFLSGPNATGTDGCTFVYGFDHVLKWRPVDNHQGWPFVSWQTEALKRDYQSDDAVDEMGNPVESNILRDWGLYTQLLYGFVRNWAIGARFGYASGKEPGAYTSRDDDPFRDTRFRVSPLLLWNASEFSRIRLQYNYDIADHLKDDYAHSVWLGFEASIGSHPAHQY